MSSRASQFEDLARRILEKNQFKFKNDGFVGYEGRFDFLAERDGFQWAIEVKFYRSAHLQVSLLSAAVSRFISQAKGMQDSVGMLVVSCFLSRSLRLAFEEKYSIFFIDRADLLYWAARSPGLLQELNSLLEPDVDLERGCGQFELFDKLDNPEERIKSKCFLSQAPSLAKDTKGTDLCGVLKSIEPGYNNWRKYENHCFEILRYLFSEDLSGWVTQKRTDDTLNRFDCVCRIRSISDFWQFLVRHFNSRFILFEFKNYSKKIKQEQILTTEKYLLERALRRVAIVMSRTGAEKNAIKMVQGAMREHGKLILVINDEVVCKMLQMKERGEDPSDFLCDISDQFLLELPR